MAPFNALVGLSGVARLHRLESLNVSHNELPAGALRALARLPELRVLRCTHNALDSLKPLAGCVALEELWVSHNGLRKKYDALAALQALPALRRLCLAPNPFTRQLKPPAYKAAVGQALPHLELLDGRPVPSAEAADVDAGPVPSSAPTRRARRPPPLSTRRREPRYVAAGPVRRAPSPPPAPGPAAFSEAPPEPEMCETPRDATFSAAQGLDMGVGA